MTSGYFLEYADQVIVFVFYLDKERRRYQRKKSENNCR